MEIITKTIGEIESLIKTGKTPPSKEERYYNGNINWYTPGDLDKGKFLGKSNRTITKEAIAENKATLLPKNTVVIGAIGDIGKVGITSSESCTNQQITGIRTNEEVYFEYFYYWLKANKQLLRSNAKNAILPILNNERIRAIKIQFPKDIDDQKRIAKVLSQCEALIQKRKESINLLDDLLQSKFNQMFFNEIFPIKTIEEVSLNIIDCPHSTPKYLNEISDYPCIRTSEIKNGQIDWTSMKYTDYDSYIQRVERLVPQAGDIIFAREGSVGDAALIPKNITLSLGQRVMMFRINPDFAIPEYIWAFIKSDKTQHLIKGRTIGTTVSRINISEVRKIQCPIPPIENQTQFAEIAQNIDTLKIQLKNSLKELENLYSSISQKAFNGQLDLSKVDISDMEDSKKKDEKSVMEKEKQDITFMTLADYLQIPEEIQMQKEGIELDFINDPLFYQFFLKNHFNDRSFLLEDVEGTFNQIYIPQGQDYNYESWKDYIFSELKSEKPKVEQFFDEESKVKQIKLKLTNEAFKA